MNRAVSVLAIPLSFAALAAMTSAQGAVRSQSAEAAAASPDAVCKFISGRMQSSLPQIPTLCSGKQEAPGDYEINVFSPQDVLEGNMRKAWSSALFQTLESLVSEKSLNGACSGKKVACFVNVTDSLMATEKIRYRLLLTGTDSLPTQGIMDSFHATEFSDTWYILWWNKGEGQTTLTSLLNSDQKGDSLTVRNAAVVRVNFGQDNSVLLQTTDGAEWRTKEQDLIRCGVSPGKEVEVLIATTPDKPPFSVISVDSGGTRCRLDVTFVRGW